MADEIYACVNKTTGALRIVSSTTVCDTRKETSLPLERTGSQGPPGPQERQAGSSSWTAPAKWWCQSLADSPLGFTQ
jgi:hypothetical protein